MVHQASQTDDLALWFSDGFQVYRIRLVVEGISRGFEALGRSVQVTAGIEEGLLRIVAEAEFAGVWLPAVEAVEHGFLQGRLITKSGSPVRVDRGSSENEEL